MRVKRKKLGDFYRVHNSQRTKKNAKSETFAQLFMRTLWRTRDTHADFHRNSSESGVLNSVLFYLFSNHITSHI
jgi:hypothetical protein